MELPILLYRWIPRVGSDARNAFQIIEHFSVNNSFIVERGLYRISASGQTVTAETYLGMGKGVGSNITGFFEYEDNKPKHIQDASPGRRTLGETNMIFGKDRDLVVIPTALIPAVTDTPLVYTDGDLVDKIVACEGITKVGKLGSLMQTATTFGQDSEWNFIPSTTLDVPAFRIVPGTYSGAGGGFVYGEYNFNEVISYINGLYEAYKSFGKITLGRMIPFDSCEVRAGKRSKIKRKSKKTRRVKKIKKSTSSSE